MSPVLECNIRAALKVNISIDYLFEKLKEQFFKPIKNQCNEQINGHSYLSFCILYNV